MAGAKPIRDYWSAVFAGWMSVHSDSQLTEPFSHYCVTNSNQHNFTKLWPQLPHTLPHLMWEIIPSIPSRWTHYTARNHATL